MYMLCGGNIEGARHGGSAAWEGALFNFLWEGRSKQGTLRSGVAIAVWRNNTERVYCQISKLENKIKKGRETGTVSKRRQLSNVPKASERYTWGWGHDLRNWQHKGHWCSQQNQFLYRGRLVEAWWVVGKENGYRTRGDNLLVGASGKCGSSLVAYGVRDCIRGE